MVAAVAEAETEVVVREGGRGVFVLSILAREESTAAATAAVVDVFMLLIA